MDTQPGPSRIPTPSEHEHANVSYLIHRALESNKTHQYNLTKYAQRLNAELAEVDKLLVRFICLPYIHFEYTAPERMPPKPRNSTSGLNLGL